MSSEVCPEFREYVRASTTAVNAAIMPLVSCYLDALESLPRGRGIVAPFYLMRSSGGVMSVQSARQRPIYMVESGPAAGVFALPHGYANVISFDMGGTTRRSA
jgi:N-methylhydantoinase A